MCTKCQDVQHTISAYIKCRLSITTTNPCFPSLQDNCHWVLFPLSISCLFTCLFTYTLMVGEGVIDIKERVCCSEATTTVMKSTSCLSVNGVEGLRLYLQKLQQNRKWPTIAAARLCALGWVDNMIKKTCVRRRRWRLLWVHSEASDKGAKAPDVVGEWPSIPFKRFNIVFGFCFFNNGHRFNGRISILFLFLFYFYSFL